MCEEEARDLPKAHQGPLGEGSSYRVVVAQYSDRPRFLNISTIQINSLLGAVLCIVEF